MIQFQNLYQTLQYTFSNINLLKEALTHSSCLGAARTSQQSNERLEFLGDRVLGLIVARMLYEAFPLETEGDLAHRHAVLVSREVVANVAVHMGLEQHMRLARSEKDRGGSQKRSILANGGEAVIAAVYLDGGIEPVTDLIYRFWAPLIKEMHKVPKDSKSSLQEWSQARKKGTPVYRVLEQKGPDHAPHFKIEVVIQDYPPIVGEGASKRQGEQDAAQKFLQQFQSAR